MDTNPIRQEYFARLNRVIDYIHAHLEEPLQLEDLASVAGFSPYHFHRIFKSMIGETLADYVQRARLERAANLLIYKPGQNLLAIGLSCGFSGSAVFSRAFRKYFGLSPSEYRLKYRKNRKADRNPGKDSDMEPPYNLVESILKNRLERSETVEVQIKNFPDLHAAYIRHIRGYSKGEFNKEINDAFQRVCKWAAARDLLSPGTMLFGIPYDNPDITPNDKCRYDACVTMPIEVTAGTGEIGIQDIPGGKYAVVHMEVTLQETAKIGEAVDKLYGEWLPASGFQADDRPPLEIYYDNPDKAPGTWISMDYCLPVRPL